MPEEEEEEDEEKTDDRSGSAGVCVCARGGNETEETDNINVH